MAFVALIIIICLFIGLFALAFILKIIGLILSPFRFLFGSSRRAKGPSAKSQSSYTAPKSSNPKVFGEKEGEYVEFEEIE